MELKDLIVTPLVVLLVLAVAYLVRNRYVPAHLRSLFIPALLLKILGALMLGIIYQFYYQGGDTFNYFDQSKILFEAFYEDPLTGIKLFLGGGEYQAETYSYAQHIYWYKSPTEYFVIKTAAFFGLFCGHTYSSIAVLFAFFSFTGLWAAYQVFVDVDPPSYKKFGIAIFFLPSLFFWGSGLMKDTIALGALGWLFYGFYYGLVKKERTLLSILIILVSFYTIYQVKIYILLSFLPPAIFWVFMENSSRIKSPVLSAISRPLLILAGVVMAYLAAINVTSGDTKYDIGNIGAQTKINAEYLYQISLLQDGSAYYLGELDGTIPSMLRIAPQAINVTLFRPYFWEISNPLMFLSAIESFAFTVLLLSLLVNPGPLLSLRLIVQKPLIMFCFMFTLILAFAVGLNSFNFGTLVRYKIQLLPFYLTGIILLKSRAREVKSTQIRQVPQAH